MNPDALTTATRVFETSRPTTKASRMTIPVTPVTPAMPARSSACDPVSAPTPWIIPTPNAVFGPYWVAWTEGVCSWPWIRAWSRSEEHTSELQSQSNLVCRLLLEKKKTNQDATQSQIWNTVFCSKTTTNIKTTETIQSKTNKNCHGRNNRC